NGDERKGGEGEVGGPPAAPAGFVAEKEESGIRGPGEQRHSHHGVEAAAFRAEPGKPDDEPQGQRRECNENRPARERVEGGLRRSALAQDTGRVGLQAPFLPEVEARQPSGERKTGERREDQPDVESEEEVPELAPTPVPG